jgi:hypothetical protein
MTNRAKPGRLMTRAWWRTNWKWVVPVAATTAVAVAVAAVFLLLAAVMHQARTSGLVVAAVEQTRQNGEVAARLGRPIETGWFIHRVLDIAPGSGSASIAIPLRGAEGRATLHVEATRAAGKWRIHSLVARIAGSGEAIEITPLMFAAATRG